MLTSCLSFAQLNKEDKLIDSLKIELTKAKEDTSKVKILNQLSTNNFYTRPKEGIKYGEAALKLATEKQWKKGIAIASYNIGICKWVNANYRESIKYFKISLLNNKDLKNQDGISTAYNQLGLLNTEIKNFKQAFIYFFEASKINKLTNNKELAGYNLYSTGEAYFKMKNYEKALEYYTQSKNIYQSINDSYGIGYSYINIGKTHAVQEKYSIAIEEYNKALNSFDDKVSYYSANTYLEIGRAYHSLSLESKKNKAKNLALSIQNLNTALHLFTNLGTFDKLNNCHQELYNAYKENGNDKLALEHFEKYVEIKEQYLSYKNEIKLEDLKTKKKIELRTKQIEIQQLQIKNDSRKLYLLVTITIASSILLILFLWLYVSKRKTNELLLTKNQEISNINKQKDKFFSIIAHDLRGPFTGFLGLTELLAEEIEELDKNEIQFAAVNMRKSATNLNRLLDNLLEWSRMEQGLIPFSPKENNVAEIVSECVAPLQETASKKDITIESNINQNITIFADQNILQSVIRNILTNALKFTPRNGIVKIEAREDSGNTIISIADNGIGMDVKMVENIFHLDIKTNRTGTENEPSTGLGLILCKEFVEKHAGKIWVESEEGKGSTFSFNFPRNNTI
jgi:signal transduction histidine kinase